MKETNEIFIQIKGIGFTFLLDKRVKHNFISPAFLAFFKPMEKQVCSLPTNNIMEVDTKLTDSYRLPFPFGDEYNISFDNIFHYVGKKVGICIDNKLRMRKVFMLKFEYGGYTFSFPFFLEKSLNVPAILRPKSFNQMIEKVMKKEYEN